MLEGLHKYRDKGKMVMTFCKKWSCPVVEMREDACFKEGEKDF